MTAAELWESYETEVLPKDAPDVQRVECKRAFYAGAFAVACIDNMSPEPIRTRLMNALYEDTFAFGNAAHRSKSN